MKTILFKVGKVVVIACDPEILPESTVDIFDPEYEQEVGGGISLTAADLDELCRQWFNLRELKQGRAV